MDLDTHPSRLIISPNGVVRRLFAGYLVLATLCVLATASLCFTAAPISRPLVGADGWRTSGFTANGVSNASELAQSILGNPQTKLWRAWTPQTNSVPGRIESLPFQAPAYFVVPLVGAPNETAGNAVGLRCIDTGREWRLPYQRSNTQWWPAPVTLPDGFCIGPVVLWANADQTRTYIGVGTPFEIDWQNWILATTGLIGLTGCLTMFGVLLVVIRAAGRLMPPWMTAFERHATAVTAALGLGIISFSAYHFSPRIGEAATILTLALCAIALRGQSLSRRRLPNGSTVSALVWISVFLTLAYVLFAISLGPSAGPWTVNSLFRPVRWSADNQIPIAFAEKLFQDAPRESLRWGPWYASDRPPLLSGLVLLVRPVADLLGVPLHLSYQFSWGAAVAAMGLWPGVVLAIASDLWGSRTARLVLMLAAVSPFILFNALYIWPKLLSGFLGLISVYALLKAHSDQYQRALAWMVVFGASAALAILAHSGVAIGLLPAAVGCLTLARRRFGAVLAGAGTGLLVLAPWVLWQNIVQPGGNALLRFGLAGDFGFNIRGQSVLSSVIRVYADAGWGGWLASRWQSLLDFTIGSSLCGWGEAGPKWIDFGLAGRIRAADFFQVPSAFKFVAVGLAAAVALRVLKGRSTKFSSLTVAALVLGASGLAVAIIVLWKCPILHHMPYVSLLLLLIGTAAAMATISKGLLLLIIVAEATGLALFWLGPGIEHATNFQPTILLSAVVALGVAAFITKFGLEEPPPPHPRTPSALRTASR